MILTCPSCSTRYSADPASFQPSGRMVRCANCGHSWFQKPPDDLPQGAAKADPSPASMRVEAAPADGEGRRAGLTLPMPISNIAIWALLVVALLGFATLLFQYRVEIVRGWPQMASAYGLFGVDVNSAGMIFRDVGFEMEEQEGVGVLAVRGTLVNITEQDLPIPRVRIALRDAGRQELYHWTVVLPQTRLEAGATTEFVTRLSSPPLGAHDIEVRFAEDDEE